MIVWKNDTSLDSYLKGIPVSVDKEKAELFLVGSQKFELPKSPLLKGIFRIGVGADNIPYEECNRRGIKVYFPSDKTKSFIYEETANFSCYLIFTLLYRNKYNFSSWEKNSRDCLNSKKLLIVGKGNIGERVYKKMLPFFILDFYDILESKREDLFSKIREADIISLHLPATKDNICFWDSKKLSAMKEGAILINASRGQIVKEEDLYDSLVKKNIAVGFDTFWEEPYSGKLLDFYPDKFYATPHVASTCNQFLSGAAEDFLSVYRNIRGK